MTYQLNNAVIKVLAVWGTMATIIDNPNSRRQRTNSIIFSIAKGGIYALTAIEYTLV